MDLTSNKICAVFVTYNPSEDIIENVKAMIPQVNKVIIIDNYSDSKSLEYIKSCEALDTKKVSATYNKFNLGIAQALNMGARYAIENSYEWLITFDQDTLAKPDLISQMFKSYDDCSYKDTIGLLAPVYYDQKTGYQSRNMRNPKADIFTTEMVFTSGSLIKTKLFNEVGYFDDDLFIDYVDTDFCLRLQKKGYLSVIVANAVIAHNEGELRKIDFGPIYFFTHNYSPTRRYYKARNMMIVYRRHWKITPKWMWIDLQFVFKDWIKLLIFENRRWQKIKYSFLGLFDGLLSRMGSIDGATYSRPKAAKYFIEEREEIFPMLPKNCDKILDLGCGTGETSYAIKKNGLANWICGVEGSPNAAELARRRLDLVLEGDIEKLDFPFEENTFDVILLLDILEHLVDPWATLEKVTKLLKPNGVIITSIPNVRHFTVVLPLLLLGDWRYQEEGLLDSTHIRFFTKSSAIKLMTSTGLKLDKLDHTGAKKGSLSGLANFLTFNILKEFFIFQNLIRVKKQQ